MKTTATNKKIRELITDIKDQRLKPRPEFQRRLVWTDKDKRAFLKTVLEQYPFPEIYIAAGDVNPDTGEGKSMLVDGQQRLTTIYQYFHGSAELILGEIQPYASLAEEKKHEFLDYDVVVRDLGRKTIEEIKEIFRRINSTKYSLNAMEINNARFDGAFKQFGDGISRHKLFKENKVFSSSEFRRMLDVQFCLLIAVTLLGTYPRRNEELEPTLKMYNDEFPQARKLREELETVFKFIASCDFGLKSRVWKKADLYTLIIELQRSLVKEGEKLEPKEVGARLTKFYSEVDAVNLPAVKPGLASEYAVLSRKGINERNNRIRRGEIIQAVIHNGVQPPKKSNP